MTEQEAKKFLKRYFKVIPGVKEWMELYKRGARRHGYTETLLGRRRYLPDLSSERFGLRGAAERRVINTRIQGSAADITNLAIRDLFRAKARGEFPADIQLMIHDEVIVTCHEDDAQRVADKMVSIMEGVVQLSIPLVVEANIGRNLKETK
jgi:DNA polymerase-1